MTNKKFLQHCVEGFNCGVNGLMCTILIATVKAIITVDLHDSLISLDPLKMALQSRNKWELIP
jgi:hypothetical protein